jgi:hypothetical protein
MKRIFGPILAVSALAMSGLGLLATTSSVSAALVSNVPIYQHLQGDRVELPVENIARRGGGRRGGYHRGGRRGGYNRRRRGYGHYYRGFWYASPWWIVGTGVAIGATTSGRCGRVSRQCRARWGSGGSNYWGCMRYDGCD